MKVFGELPAGVLWPTARFPAAAGSGSSGTPVHSLRSGALRRSPDIVHFVELYHGEYDRERLIYSLRAYEPKFIYAAGKAEKELRGVKRYVNLFYRIYNGRRKHDILPMKF